MKLTYRGVSYDYNPPTIETSESNVDGKYRGLDWRFRNLKKPPVLQPNANLTYRGVTYQTAGTNTDSSVKPGVNPTRSTQEKARSLMMDTFRTLKQRQQAMLNRSAAEIGLTVDS